jgi:hypothetical protein
MSLVVIVYMADYADLNPRRTYKHDHYRLWAMIASAIATVSLFDSTW